MGHRLGTPALRHCISLPGSYMFAYTLCFMIFHASSLIKVVSLFQPTVVNECISPLLSLLTSATTSFPSGAPARSVLCLKLVDLLYVLGLRLGLERTRRYLHVPMLRLMEVFSLVHGSENTTTSQPSSPGKTKITFFTKCWCVFVLVSCF